MKTKEIEKLKKENTETMGMILAHSKAVQYEKLKNERDIKKIKKQINKMNEICECGFKKKYHQIKNKRSYMDLKGLCKKFQEKK